MAGPDVDFWQARFDTGQMAWDRGEASPQLLRWLDRQLMPPGRILVPGCGSGWEVVALAKRGFDVVALDYTEAAISLTREHCAREGVTVELVQADALTYVPSKDFDAIYEQTCLCAIHPDHWLAYAAQLHRWLKPGGSLWALFMQYPRADALNEGWVQGPPYHCDINAMRVLFHPSSWGWPAPPYEKVPHPRLSHELAMRLIRL